MVFNQWKYYYVLWTPFKYLQIVMGGVNLLSGGVSLLYEEPSSPVKIFKWSAEERGVKPLLEMPLTGYGTETDTTSAAEKFFGMMIK